MTFHLNDVVPWGRSYQEYVDMFALTETDLSGRILGCGDGPAGFNAELTERGGAIVSIDPLYAFEPGDISSRIDETFENILHQAKENMDEFIWSRIRSVEELGQVRMKAMQEFLTDYPAGRSEGRYLAQSLPELDFPDNAFDIALCSHFLFLYSDILDLNFHIASISELCRVSSEVRVFPLLELGATESGHIQPAIEHFESKGFAAEKVQVDYEFQRGGNQMLRIRRSRH